MGRGGGGGGRSSPSGGGGVPTIPTTPEDAAKQILSDLMKNDENLRNDPKLQERVYNNWLKEMRPAMRGISKDDYATAQAAIKDAYSSKAFRDYVKKYGESGVVFRKGGDGANGERIGNTIHIYKTGFKSDKDIKQVSEVVRHEYGHKVFDTYSSSEKRAFVEKVTPIAKEISPYAKMKTSTEAFPELFAIATSRSYKTDNVPTSVRKIVKDVLDI